MEAARAVDVRSHCERIFATSSSAATRYSSTVAILSQLPIWESCRLMRRMLGINRGVRAAKVVPLRLHLSSDTAAQDKGSSEAVVDGRMASVAGVGRRIQAQEQQNRDWEDDNHDDGDDTDTNYTLRGV